VETHRGLLFKKLALRDTADLIRFAAAAGIPAPRTKRTS
jgi:hypothetical protein